MELFLNLAGALISIAMVGLWLRWRPLGGCAPWKQAVALSLLLLILFPMISMTDDLLAVQNPAEVVVALRLDHQTLCAHSLLPATIAIVEPIQEENHSSFLRIAVPGTLPASVLNPPAIAPIENRPPPSLA